MTWRVGTPQWVVDLYRVAGSTRGLDEAEVYRVARIIQRERRAGRNACVWHATSIYRGRLENCPCVQCRKH